MFAEQDDLFYGLILFFGVALSACLYMVPDPGPQMVRTIEIDMADAPNDRGRHIPSPRRHRDVPKPCSAVPLPAAPVPVAPPSLAGPPSTAPMTTVTLPDFPSSGGTFPAASGFSATAAEAMAGFMTRQDYYDLIKMRVEALKQYPPQARKDAVQGEVVVRFELDENGGVTSVQVHKSSGSSGLDQAAVQAVKQATPFPHPPSGLFTYPLRLQLAIQFMLT